MAPARIALSMVDQPSDEQSFNQKENTARDAVGRQFHVGFLRTVSWQSANWNPAWLFVEKSGPNKMIVVADGDIIRNRFNLREGTPYPLGFDPKSGEYNRPTKPSCSTA